MRITIGLPELCCYLLWLGVGVAALIDYRAHAHIAGLTAILLAMIACTVHVRIGQQKVAERVGDMLHLAELEADVAQLHRRTR